MSEKGKGGWHVRESDGHDMGHSWFQRHSGEFIGGGQGFVVGRVGSGVGRHVWRKRKKIKSFGWEQVQRGCLDWGRWFQTAFLFCRSPAASLGLLQDLHASFIMIFSKEERGNVNTAGRGKKTVFIVGV